MSATSFADFLGEKLNDLRNCVVAEYSTYTNNLEQEASVLRSQNGRLREQLKLCDSRSPEDAHDTRSEPLPEPQQAAEESHGAKSLQEDSKSEEQAVAPEAADCPRRPPELAPCTNGTDTTADCEKESSSPSYPQLGLEPLEEGEEDEEEHRTSVASGASSRQQESPSNKDETPPEASSLLTLDIPSSLDERPRNSALSDLPLQLPEPQKISEATPWSPTSKLTMGHPLPGQNCTGTDSSGSSPDSMHSNRISLMQAKLQSSSQNSLQPRPPLGRNRQSVASVMSRAFNGGPTWAGPVANMQSNLSVPSRQSILPLPHQGRSPKASIHGNGGLSPTASGNFQELQPWPGEASQTSQVSVRQVAAACAAMTDMLDEFEGKHMKSPTNSLGLSSLRPPPSSSDEANGHRGNFNGPDQYGVEGKDDPWMVQTDTDGDNPEIVFEVWPVWNFKKDFKLQRKGAGANSMLEDAMSTYEKDDSDEEEDNVEEIPGWLLLRILTLIIMSPSSANRILWDCLGVLCISYEFVMLPLQFLSLPQGPFMQGAAWAMRLYWTCDFPLSFITGYNRADGRTEKRPIMIAKHYVSSWMPFDVCVLTLDWSEIALGGLDSLGAARSAKAFKALRLLRMLRLIRLVRLRRMPEFLRVIAYKFQGERFVIVFGIFRIMIFLVGINHFIACCWYGIGDSPGDEPAGETESHTGCETTSQESKTHGWVYEYNYDRQDLGYRYLTSFHWSITQFTGSADIYPQNVGERSFAVISLLFGFLLSASVVSSITSSMTRLQIVTARQSTQVSMLKQYLFDNGISTKVALRVQRNAMYTLSQATKNTPESSIELLSLVSEPLRMDLHYEIHLPTLCQHPFFKCYNEVNSPAMKKVCHTCVSQLPLSRGDVLFSSGEIPPTPCTYFCISGKLQYLQEYGYTNGAKNMYAGNWACEHVLWTAWVHIGMLRAKTECSLQLLSAGSFQSIASQFQTREFYPGKYAGAFVEQLNAMDKEFLSDLSTPDLDIDAICDTVFPRARLSDRRGSALSAASGVSTGLSRESSSQSHRPRSELNAKTSGSSKKSSTMGAPQENRYRKAKMSVGSQKSILSSGTAQSLTSSQPPGGSVDSSFFNVRGSASSKASSNLSRITPTPSDGHRKDADGQFSSW